MVYGVWCVVYGVWCMVCGLRGAWCVVCVLCENAKVKNDAREKKYGCTYLRILHVTSWSHVINERVEKTTILILCVVLRLMPLDGIYCFFHTCELYMAGNIIKILCVDVSDFNECNKLI
jgi:hypothetical protein